MIRDRVRFHLEQGRAYVQAFVNHGRAAGASIEHPHAQIVALDAVPPAVDEMTERFDHRPRRAGARRRPPQRTRRGRRARAGVGPPVSWSPYGMRVAHRSTRARFDEATDAEIAVVAVALRDALAASTALLGDVAVQRGHPHRAARAHAGEFHWHVDVLPRTGVVAGFEVGTGIFVNVVPRERRPVARRRAATAVAS